MRPISHLKNILQTKQDIDSYKRMLVSRALFNLKTYKSKFPILILDYRPQFLHSFCKKLHQFMLEGNYTCSRQFSPEQREADEDHGIFQVLNRTLTFTAPNNFKYLYHYYYEYEAGYVMREQVKNDTAFSGTYTIDGNYFLLTVTAGEQVAVDEVNNKNLAGKQNINGSIILVQQGTGLKVASVKLNLEGMDRRYQIILQGSTFKKA